MYIATLEPADTLNTETEEFEETGSYNHGFVQVRLAILLDQVGNYTPISELTLDVSEIELSKFDLKVREEIKPDICLYPKRGIYRPTDILRMKEMPLLAVEILSPRQGVYDIVEKFKVYFELGVKSCWLVEPILGTVTVYATIDKYRTFSEGEVTDETLGIRLALEQIFS